jgi:AraC-like DNA-binding protein
MAGAATFPIEPGWRPLLKDMGLRVDRVLRRAGLPDDLLSRPQAGLTTAEYFRWWESLATEANDPLFALRLVETLQAESFVPPIFAALCSANMLQAVQRLATYKRLIAPMRLHIGIDRRGDLTLTPQWLEAEGRVPQALIVVELAFLLRLARLATREPIAALRVTMPRLPDAAQAEAYTRYFGVVPRRAAVAGLTLSALDAKRPFLTENAAMWRVFEPDLRRRLGELDASATTATRVRAALLELLPGGESSIEAVAQRLTLSKRTLQRRLEDEGENFRTLVNRTREDLARHYLTQTHLSVNEIGFLLGFEDPNSFFRAFHTWTGKTPEAARRAAH